MISKKIIRRKLVHIKVYLGRAMSYASIVNMGLILFLALSNLEKYGIDIKLETWIFPIFAAMGLLLIMFGYIEDKLGIFGEEQGLVSTRIPQFHEIIERLDKIEKKL